jgi:hypothetical protein
MGWHHIIIIAREIAWHKNGAPFKMDHFFLRGIKSFAKSMCTTTKGHCLKFGLAPNLC